MDRRNAAGATCEDVGELEARTPPVSSTRLIDGASDEAPARHVEPVLELCLDADEQDVVFELAELGTVSYDRRHDRMRLDRSSLAMFGLDDDGDLTMSDFLRSVHADDRERAAIAFVHDGGDLELRTLALIGGRRVAARLRSTSAGDVVVGIFRDVTAERREIEARDAALKSLEGVLKVQKAQNVARAAELADVTYAVQAALVEILGWSARLQAEGPALNPGRLKTGLLSISKQARTQLPRLANVLDATSVVQGKLVRRSSAVDVRAMLDAAIRSARWEAESSAISLRVNLDPALGSMLGDRVRLAQIVSNVLGHLVQITPPRGFVELVARREGSVIAIRLAGGRVTGPTSPEGHGVHVGMGISLARQLVEMHRGQMTVSGGGGDGERAAVVFDIQLPVNFVLGPLSYPRA